MSKTTEEQHFFDQMWEFWTPTGAEFPPCILCYEQAVTLHEINPRSTNPDWLDQPFNSCPVCTKCHDQVQMDPVQSGIKLHALVVERAQATANWKGLDYDRVVRELWET